MIDRKLPTGPWRTIRLLHDELDAKDARIAEESAIVDRVWKALGIRTYDDARGIAIDEHVTRLIARIEKLRRHIMYQRYADDAAREAAEAALAADAEAAKG